MSNTTWLTCPNLVIWQDSTYFCVFNSLSSPAISIMTKEMFWILKQFKTPSTIASVYQRALRKDKRLTKARFTKLHGLLAARHLLTEENQLPFPVRLAKHLGVWLHLTNQCNLRCTYCYIQKSAARFDETKLESTLNNIFASASQHNFRSLTIKMSGGECLLELKQVIKVVEIGRLLATKYNLSFRPVVMSNGVLITDRTANLLKQLDIHVAISLDGIGPYHDKHRIFPSGLGSYKAVIAGLSELKKAGVSHNCLVTITKDNEDNLLDLTGFFLSQNIPFAFNFFRENEVATKDSSTAIAHDEKLIKNLKSCYKLISKARPTETLLHYLLDRVDLTSTHAQVCGRGKSYLVIGQDGQLYPCQMDIGHAPLSPCLTEDPISVMQSWGVDHPHHAPSSCKQCPYFHYCAGGCPRLNSDTVMSPYCHIYQALIPYLLKLEAKRIIKVADLRFP